MICWSSSAPLLLDSRTFPAACRISPQTHSTSSSLVTMPVPEARLTPSSAKKFPDRPQDSSLAALLRSAAACVLVTLLRMLSMRKRCAKPFLSASNGDRARVGSAERDALLLARAAEGHVAPVNGPRVDES